MPRRNKRISWAQFRRDSWKLRQAEKDRRRRKMPETTLAKGAA